MVNKRVCICGGSYAVRENPAGRAIKRSPKANSCCFDIRKCEKIRVNKKFIFKSGSLGMYPFYSLRLLQLEKE